MRYLDIDEAVVQATHGRDGGTEPGPHTGGRAGIILVDTAAEVPDSPLFRRQRADHERLIEIARTGHSGIRRAAEDDPAAAAGRDNPEFIRPWRGSSYHLTGCLHSLLQRLRSSPSGAAEHWCPHIVCGENDEPFYFAKMHAAIAGSELVIIPGAGMVRRWRRRQSSTTCSSGFCLASRRQLLPDAGR
jgi:hypothetical protein